MHFTTRDTLLLVLVVNVTASLGALAFGYVQDRLGTCHHRADAGRLVRDGGDRLGQPHARGLLGRRQHRRRVPGREPVGGPRPGRLPQPGLAALEFFGLWGFAVKAGLDSGPGHLRLVTWLTASDHRLAMLVTGVFFLLGLAVLAGIDVRRGRRTALREERKLQKTADATQYGRGEDETQENKSLGRD
jgi:UMF1 family MFS transporter